MVQLGEIIHGHYGQYVTKHYGTASGTEVQDFFLKNTEAGEQDSCNRIVCLGTQKLPGYMWSTFVSAHGALETAAGYVHVVYQPCTLGNMYMMSELLAFPFVSASECMEYLGNTGVFTEETRAAELKNTTPFHWRGQLRIDPELITDLACYCVGKVRTNSRNYLKILVPQEVEDYQGYCLEAICQIIGAIPAGLRAGLCFATNVPESNAGFFGVTFKRDEGEMKPGFVRLNGAFEKHFLKDVYLPESLDKIIRFCAKKPEFAEKCYREMEEPLVSEGKWTEECYGRYAAFCELRTEPFGGDFLRRLDSMLLSAETDWEKRCLESVIQERIKNVPSMKETLEKEVSEQGEKSQSAEEAFSILEVLAEVFEEDFGGSVENSRMSGETCGKQRYFRPTFEIQRKKYVEIRLMRSVLREPQKETAEKVEYVCKEMRKRFPEDTEEFADTLAREILLPMYAHKRAEEIPEFEEVDRTMKILSEYSGGGNVNRELKFWYDSCKIEQIKQKIQRFPETEDVKRIFELMKKAMPQRKMEVELFVLRNTEAYFDRCSQTEQEASEYRALFGKLKKLRVTVLEQIPNAEKDWKNEKRSFDREYENCFRRHLLQYADASFTPDRVNEVLKLAEELQNRQRFYKDLSRIVKKNIQEGKSTREEIDEIYEYFRETEGTYNSLKSWYSELVKEERWEKKFEEIGRQTVSFEKSVDRHGPARRKGALAGNRRGKRRKRSRSYRRKKLLLIFSIVGVVVAAALITTTVLFFKNNRNVQTQASEKQVVWEEQETAAGEIMSEETVTDILSEAADTWILEGAYTRAIREFEKVKVGDVVRYMENLQASDKKAQAVREYLTFFIMQEITENASDGSHYDIRNVDFYDVSGLEETGKIAEGCAAVMLLTTVDQNGDNRNRLYYFDETGGDYVEYTSVLPGMSLTPSELQAYIKKEAEMIHSTRTGHVQSAIVEYTD